uniref:Uncharacterized protein n=1 Tax=Arundo donax TaxID=35708 RepID=A0A0A9FVM2_ARUDO
MQPKLRPLQREIPHPTQGNSASDGKLDHWR